jgi:hypothetical protein
MSFQKIYASQPNTALESEGRGGEGRDGETGTDGSESVYFGGFSSSAYKNWRFLEENTSSGSCIPQELRREPSANMIMS